MAQEMNEGVSYLRALKQSSGSGTSAAPAKDAEKPSTETTGERFAGAEKRRTTRYKCEGSSEIREDGCDVRTWATFTDISLHGCYVEAQATYPAGTVLHMKMEANGVRFETIGTVRVTYPYLGMGIAFTDISDENVIQLRQLLARISRPCVVMGAGIPSSFAATEPLSLPAITKPEAAVAAVIEFFGSRQMLLRDDFVRLLKKSQT
jgi:hypothetical protein